MKKIKYFLSCIAFIFMMSITTLASDAKNTTFSEFITSCYGEENLQVYNKNGENITSQFLSDTLPLYETKNFDAIQKYSEEHVGRFSCLDIKENITKAGKSITINGWDAPYFSWTESIAHATGYVKVDMTGKYSYDITSGEILSTSNPTINFVEFVEFSSLWTMSASKISSRSYINGSGMYANFEAQVTIYGKSSVESTYPVDKDLGTVKATIRGDANGIVY